MRGTLAVIEKEKKGDNVSGEKINPKIGSLLVTVSRKKKTSRTP